MREFEKSIETNVSAILSEDAKSVRRAAKIGKSLIQIGNSSRLADDIDALATTLLDNTAGPDTPGKAAHTSPTGVSTILGQIGRLLSGKVKIA